MLSRDFLLTKITERKTYLGFFIESYLVLPSPKVSKRYLCLSR